MQRTRVWLAIVASLGACGEPTRLDVRLSHPGGLVPAEALRELTAEVIALDDGHVVASRTVAGSALGGPTVLFDDAELVDGERYVLRVHGPAPRACRYGRAAGRSRPFEHTDADYAVPVMLGCVDELAPLTSAPLRARLGHAVAPDGRGGAVIAGGTAQAVPGDGTLRWTDPEALTERWEPLAARFAAGPSLREPRVLPGLATLPGGAVAVVGGFIGWPTSCSATAELVAGTTSVAAGPLASARCSPVVAALPVVERVLVVGGSFASPTVRSTDAELWDSRLRTQLGEGLTASGFRGVSTGVVLSDGASALVVGGNATTAPVAELARVPGDCGRAACFEPVAGGPPGPVSWSGATASWVPCASGGGAVYVVGGQLQTTDQPERVIAEAWCYGDTPGAAPALVPAGQLPAVRSGHVAVSVEGPGGAWRLLVAGGTRSTGLRDGLPYTEALLVPVDGCSCAPLDPAAATALDVPMAGYVLLAAATRLPDGTALIVGGTRFAPSASGPSLEATGEAAIFVPDPGP